MNATMESPTVDIHDVAIDHVNVDRAKNSKSAQTWVALTPLLTVLITATGLVFSFCFQMVQNHTTSRQKVDSDWREALEKTTTNEESAGFVAFEMESFATDPVYGKHAKSITAAVLPAIKSQFEFDTAFFGLLEHTTEDDQDQVVSVDRKLSLELMKLRDGVLKSSQNLPADTSVSNFVQHPELFFTDDDPLLAQAQTAGWKLDTVSGGLSSLWLGTKLRHAVKPQDVDLTGAIFLNNDFRGIDFRQAGMADTMFLGSCRVDQKKLPSGTPRMCGN